VFTGGVVQKNWKIRCGLGLWALHPLPLHLTLYLQSEVHAALNAANIAMLCVLIHWFVTPGIAAVVSRKTPVKFLGWFCRFLLAILDGATLLGATPFGVDRVRGGDPRRLIENLQYAPDHTPPFKPTALALCIPFWRNVTGGGCLSDQRAFDHLISTVRVMLSAPDVPKHLRWESDLRIIDGFLTGKPSPSAASVMPIGVACVFDEAMRSIPRVMDSVPGYATEPFRNVLRKYRAALPLRHELKHATVNQLLLLYTWQHPGAVLDMCDLTVSGVRRLFYTDDFDLVRPLAIAFAGSENVIPLPDIYVKFRRDRLVAKQLHHAKTLQAASALTSDRPNKRKIQRKFRHVRRKLFKAGVDLGRTLLSNQSQRGVEVEPPVILLCEEGASSKRTQFPAPEEEIRVVSFTASPSPERWLDEDVLDVDTPAWDLL
jgi:hypothetical protein